MAKLSLNRLLATGAQIATGAMQGHQAGLAQRRAQEEASLQQALQIAQIQQAEIARQEQAKQQQAQVLSSLLPNLAGDSQGAALEQIMGAYAPSNQPSPYAGVLNSPLVQRRLGKLGIQSPAMPAAVPAPAPGLGQPSSGATMGAPVGSAPPRLKFVNPALREAYTAPIKALSEALDPAAARPIRDPAQRRLIQQRITELREAYRAGTPISEFGDIYAGITPPEDPKLEEERRKQAYETQVAEQKRQDERQQALRTGAQRAYLEVYNAPGANTLPLSERHRRATRARQQFLQAFNEQIAAEDSASAPPAPEAPIVPGGVAAGPAQGPLPPNAPLADALAEGATLRNAPTGMAGAAPAVEADIPGYLTPEQQAAQDANERARKESERNDREEIRTAAEQKQRMLEREANMSRAERDELRKDRELQLKIDEQLRQNQNSEFDRRLRTAAQVLREAEFRVKRGGLKSEDNRRRILKDRLNGTLSLLRAAESVYPDFDSEGKLKDEKVVKYRTQAEEILNKLATLGTAERGANLDPKTGFDDADRRAIEKLVQNEGLTRAQAENSVRRLKKTTGAR